MRCWIKRWIGKCGGTWKSVLTRLDAKRGGKFPESLSILASYLLRKTDAKVGSEVHGDPKNPSPRAFSGLKITLAGGLEAWRRRWRFERVMLATEWHLFVSLRRGEPRKWEYQGQQRQRQEM